MLTGKVAFTVARLFKRTLNAVKSDALKKQKITDGFDLTIYTETVQAAGHSSAKEAFARMMERQEGGQV